MEIVKTIEYYMSLKYPMEIIPDEYEEGYALIFPDLPGCLTCVDSLDEIKKFAEDCKRAWFLAELEEGHEIPKPFSIKNMTAKNG